MKVFHDGIHTIEQHFTRDKWFTLACLALFMMTSLGLSAVMNKSTSGAGCYLDAEKTLFGVPRSKTYAHEVSTEAIMQARTHYSVCLLANGIDVRSVPEFEELFPFTAEYQKSDIVNDVFETTE